MDFKLCYYLLLVIKIIAKYLIGIWFESNDSVYIVFRNIYLWLLKQPSTSVKKILEMCASGVFGSTLVTGLVYYVEYKVQNKIYICKFLDLQRDYVNKLNEITCVFTLGQKESSSAILAYYEYAENCWKQSEYFEYSKMINSDSELIIFEYSKYSLINSDSELSEQEKTEKLEDYKSNYLFYKHDKAEKYKDFVWIHMDEEKKSRIEKMGDKKRYLAQELENLLKSADIEIFSAFNDYEDTYFLDISEIKHLANEIQFMGFSKKLKSNIIQNVVDKDEHNRLKIMLILFPYTDIRDKEYQFCRNRIEITKGVLALQRLYFSEADEGKIQSQAVIDYLEEEKMIKEKILNEKYEEVTFREPKRCVEITVGEGKFTDTFIKKVYKQGWDYNTFFNVDLKELGY